MSVLIPENSRSRTLERFRPGARKERRARRLIASYLSFQPSPAAPARADVERLSAVLRFTVHMRGDRVDYEETARNLLRWDVHLPKGHGVTWTTV